MRPAEPAEPQAFPKTLGRYDVRAKIGEGGMAAVYVGRAPDGRLVAIKVIKESLLMSRDFVNMFIDEARIASKLSHPNIVEIFELGDDGGRPFLVMELLSGQSLWDVWEACRARGVRMRPEVVAFIGARVADGLHHAHELRDVKGQAQGIVHRDVNPSNVLITYEGGVKVIDFGLAKAINRLSKTAAGVVKGKLAYLSPEQAAGNAIDRRADIFALGTSLWELSVDRRLFRHKDDIETLRRIHAAEVPEPSSVIPSYPAAFWRILKRALAREASHRYATAAEMARELDAFAKSSTSAADARSVSLLVRELFVSEKERQMAFFADASAPRAVSLATLRPPSQHESVVPAAPTASALSPALVIPSAPRAPDVASPIAPARSAPASRDARPTRRNTALVGMLVALAALLAAAVTVLARR